MNAKKSRLRKKLFIDALVTRVTELEAENMRLKESMKQQRPATEKSSAPKASEFPADINPQSALMCEADHELVAFLRRTQHSFTITDPNIPDNPIVFASEGFLTLSGYDRSEVIGQNCRFMQGPGSDPAEIRRLGLAVRTLQECSATLINFRKDGTPFWNHIYIAPLRDATGRVTNFIGIQVCVPHVDN